MHIHLLGPSGSGTSTLGRLIALHYDLPFFDTDDFFWLPTNPPFTSKRERQDRIHLLAQSLAPHDDWVLGGSMMGWGDFLRDTLDLVIYLYALPGERIQRLTQREHQRFGSRIDPGGDMHAQHCAFIDWAKSYETGGLDMRSKASEEQWLEGLDCPVLRPQVGWSPQQCLHAASQALCTLQNTKRGFGPSCHGESEE